MKFYTEILDLKNNKVLWHYYIEAPSEEKAKAAASDKFIEEQKDGLLLEIGGLFAVTATREE